MAYIIKKLLPKILFTLLFVTLLTAGLSKYVPVTPFDIRNVDAAFSSWRAMGGASILAGGDKTSYRFDGSAGFLEIPDHADFDFVGSAVTDRTLSFFVKVINSPTANTEMVAQHEDNNNRWAFFLSSGITPRFLVTSTTNIIDFRGGTIDDSNWHHVALCKVSAEYGIYIDGIQTAFVDDSSTDTFAGNLFIGEKSFTTLGGFVDEVRLYHGNPFTAAPNGTNTDTIAVPVAEHAVDTNTKLLIHCGEDYTGALLDEPAQPVYAFDGTADYLSSPDHADWDFGTGEWTIECWVNLASTTGTQGIMSTREVGADGWRLEYNSSAIRFRNVAGGGTDIDASSAYTFTNSWHHVAAVRSSNTVTIYIDGVDAGTTADATGKPVVGETAGMVVGRNESNSAGSYFGGKLTELRISKVARWTTGFTPSTTRYTSDANTNLLIHGDEHKIGTTGSAATFVDSGNTGHTMTEVAGAISGNGGTFLDSGNTGHVVSENISAVRETESEYIFDPDATGYSLDGAGDFLEIPDSTDWDFGASDFVVDMWVRLNSQPGTDELMTFVSKFTATGNQRSWRWVYHNNSNIKKMFWAWSTDGTAETLFNVTHTLDLNVWTHIALVRSGATLYQFVNGSSIGSQAATTPFASTSDLWVGGYPDFSWELDGLVDEIRISTGTDRGWSSGFTPETAQHVSDANTKLLIHCGEDYNIPFTDESVAPVYSFDGTGDSLSAPNHADFQPVGTDFTVEGWAKTTSSGNIAIAAVFSTTGNRRSFKINIDTGVAVFAASNDGTSSFIWNITGTTSINDGLWHHVAGVRDGTAQYLFVDGTKEGTDGTATADVYTNTADPFEIGSTNNGASNAFDGKITEVRHSSIARWTTGFTPSTSRYVSDANTHLLVHTDEVYTFPFSSEAEQPVYTFDGTGDYLSTPDNADWNLGSVFTIDWWVFPEAGGIAGQQSMVLQQADSTNRFAVWVNGTTRTVQFNVGGTSLASSSPLVEGVWTHIMIVRTGGTTTMYFDGTSVGSNSHADIADYAAALQWGATTSTTNEFMGKMTEMRISDIARETGTFTPSTSRYTSDVNTLLLIHTDEFKTGTTGSGATFVDTSFVHTMTENGNAVAEQGGAFTDSGDTGHTVVEVGNAIRVGSGDFTDSGNTGHAVKEVEDAKRATENLYKH